MRPTDPPAHFALREKRLRQKSLGAGGPTLHSGRREVFCAKVKVFASPPQQLCTYSIYNKNKNSKFYYSIIYILSLSMSLWGGVSNGFFSARNRSSCQGRSLPSTSRRGSLKPKPAGPPTFCILNKWRVKMFILGTAHEVPQHPPVHFALRGNHEGDFSAGGGPPWSHPAFGAARSILRQSWRRN